MITTIEQSKRLIAAGIDIKTADMQASKDMPKFRKKLYPAWSMGALWNLCGDIPLEFCTTYERAEDVIEAIVSVLEGK